MLKLKQRFQVRIITIQSMHFDYRNHVRKAKNYQQNYELL